MKRIYCIAFVLFSVAGSFAQQKNLPNWQVNASHFQYSATITAKVLHNNASIPSGTVILGAFAGSEIRGVATPLAFNGEYYFFLTVYTNSPIDSIRFKVYYGTLDSIISVAESLAVIPNGVYGSVGSPYLIRTSFNVNPPVTLSGIPDQTIESGGAFSQIDLSLYVHNPAGVVLEYSHRNNRTLTLGITGALVSVSYPSGWKGKDTVIFRAAQTARPTLFVEDTVVFAVVKADNPPRFSVVPGQRTGKNRNFENLDLRNFVNELDGDTLLFRYEYMRSGMVEPAPVWAVQSAVFASTMTITARVSFPGGAVQGAANKLAAFKNAELRGNANGIQYGDTQLFFLTVYANSYGDTISFSYYDATLQKLVSVSERLVFTPNASLGTPANPYVMTAGNIIADIGTNGHLRLRRPDRTWTGEERIRFFVKDGGTLNAYQDTASAVFEVLNDNTPLIDGIPTQIAVRPAGFAPLDLNPYITELDGHAFTVSAINSTHLQVSVSGNNIAAISVTSSGWTGSERIIFRITDNTPNGLSAQDTVLFTMRGADNRPLFGSLPQQTVTSGGAFLPLNLRHFVTELDGDSIEFTISTAPSLPNVPSPDWQVNPSLYELNMNITAEITSAGVRPSGALHKLAAFVGNSLRGIATPLQLNGRWLYFLTVYSNSQGEKISFKFFDAGMQKIYPVQGTTNFSANAVSGSPANPVQMKAGFVLFTLVGGQTVAATLADSTWTGEETLRVVVKDLLTANQYEDTSIVVFSSLSRAAIQINLTALLEGRYNVGTGKMRPDTVNVSLRQTEAPFTQADFTMVVLDSLGRGAAAFKNSVTGTYYLVIIHRNSIETWSRAGGEIFTNGSTTAYDFTTGPERAYMNNLKEKGGRYCIYGGDVNQDGAIDFSDLAPIDNDNFRMRTGYAVTDLNGDGFVDLSDLHIADNNSINYVGAVSPLFEWEKGK